MATGCDQNVFMLQVPVIDPNGMTILYGIQDLPEGVFGKCVVSDEMASFGDIGKQVALRAELNNHKCTVRTVQYPNQRDHVGMLISQVMKSDFSLLEFPLSGFQTSFV